MLRPPTFLGLSALILAVGCNAGTSGGIRKQEPAQAKETISKARIIAKHNENASTIRSLMATPSISVASGERQDRYQGHLSGRMAMERNKDFRLEISTALNRKQADIGSNAEGFWFWVKDNPDKALYFCKYDQLNNSALTVTMQPEWIMEAMGLREISEREAATISASKGDKPGQLILTQLRNDPKGGTLTKVTVVDESTGEILEHRLYAGAKEKLLAKATIAQPQLHIKMKPTDGDPGGSMVSFPSRMQLEWVVEKFSLDITMGTPTINPTFAKSQKLALFERPEIDGAIPTDLAKLGGPPASASSRVYESSPRSGVRLGRPEVEPMGVEGALPPSRELVPSSTDLSENFPKSDRYVGPPIPSAVDTSAVQASSRSNYGLGTFNR